MPMVQLINCLFDWSFHQKVEKEVRKGKGNNANLSFGWPVHWYWPSQKKKETRTGGNQLAKTEKESSEAEGTPHQSFATPLACHVIETADNTTKTNKELTPMVWSWSIITSVLSNAGKATRKVSKGKSTNANLSLGWHVNQYWASDKKGRSRDRGANGSIPMLGNQLAKTQKRQQRSRRDTLSIICCSSPRCHVTATGTTPQKHTNKSQCQWFNQSSIWLRLMLENPKKLRKGAANANLLFGWCVDRYWPSNKKGRSKDRGANGSNPLLSKQFAKTHKRKQRSRRDTLLIVCCSSSGMSCCCNCGWHHKNKQIRANAMVWLIISLFKTNTGKTLKSKKSESHQCQPFVQLVCWLLLAK